MVVPWVVLALVLLLLLEALILWVGELRSHRRDAAYCWQRAHRPPLYDWSQERDL